MGIDYNSAKFLLWGREKGVDYSRTLTIGRQGLHLPVSLLGKVLGKFGMVKSRSELAEMFAEQKGFAEPFLQLLGATETTSMDASGFEGATCVHDLNQRVPAEWQGRYSVVFDGGTLEHVFDYPTGLRNCLEMVAVGGHFLSLTPANNYMGHGFYQLSPELFARVFQEENGFSLEKMVLFEIGSNQWYEVIDPAQAGRRVQLVNRRPTLMGVWARKVRHAQIFARAPQQSDYAAKWTQRNGQDRNDAPVCRESLRQQRPWLLRWVRGLKKWFKPRFSSKFYKPVEF